ncbi:response regulator [Pseudonocardia sp. DLS-67]
MTDQTGAGERNAAIRVLLVDDHSVVRRGVRAYLDGYDDIEVAAEAASGGESLNRLAAMAAHGELPDVVLIDLLMRGLDGVAATASIVQRHPTIRVVVLTSFGERERVHAALASGATGFLLKDAKPSEIVAAIRAVAGGGVFLDPVVARRLTQEILSPATGLAALTDRERAVLVLVAEGRSNQEIADELAISERTVRTHVSGMLRKLGLSSRTQAAVVAVREGMLPADP